MKSIYLVGSLRNPDIPRIANQMRVIGFNVFDDWFAAGEKADDAWRDYEKARGHTYIEALQGHAAKHVYEFDAQHLRRADIVVLVMPAGRSGHLELGWAAGAGKVTAVVIDDPERWDVMYQFANYVAPDLAALYAWLETCK